MQFVEVLRIITFQLLTIICFFAKCYLSYLVTFHVLFNPLKRLHNIKEFSPDLKENTTLHHYEDQMDNGA
jgi:hypothetical protein